MVLSFSIIDILSEFLCVLLVNTLSDKIWLIGRMADHVSCCDEKVFTTHYSLLIFWIFKNIYSILKLFLGFSINFLLVLEDWLFVFLNDIIEIYIYCIYLKFNHFKVYNTLIFIHKIVPYWYNFILGHFLHAKKKFLTY